VFAYGLDMSWRRQRPVPTMEVDMTVYNIQVSKINAVESFDDTKLPEASRVYLMNYGLTQALGDAHAGCTEKAFPDEAARIAEARKRVQARVDQIRTGQVPKTTVVSPALVAAAKAGMTEAQVIALIEAATAKNKKSA